MIELTLKVRDSEGTSREFSITDPNGSDSRQLSGMLREALASTDFPEQALLFARCICQFCDEYEPNGSHLLALWTAAEEYRAMMIKGRSDEDLT